MVKVLVLLAVGALLAKLSESDFRAYLKSLFGKAELGAEAGEAYAKSLEKKI